MKKGGVEQERPFQSEREREFWMSGKWTELQLGHANLFIRVDGDGRVVIPRETLRTIGMVEGSHKARVFGVRNVEDLAAASGTRTRALMSKGAKAVLLLFSAKQEGVEE
jgi:hypothetical protein